PARGGGTLEIRALRPDDRAGLLAAVDHTSAQSLYLRFFGARRRFTDREITFFLNVDFTSHVALVATAEHEGERVIVGGARYIVTRPAQAEVAITVIDACQGQGIGGILMRHLVGIARERGLTELAAEVLSENTRMLKIFSRCGLPLKRKREAGAIHVVLQLNA
ncbi:GNAT family N-acetyltransferase, partial [Methylorubrum podarium]|uniref:GNAT family N-acetyltransferase n=1 Tax=Methylorubrum podarium TaxID=200476 RepID=UPI0035A25562